MSIASRIGFVGYGVAWLAVAGLVAIVIRLQVPNPEELLRDVADRRALWIGANALLIASQALLVLVVPALARLVGGGSVAGDAVRGFMAIAGGALIASGVFHGVLGAHLASKVTAGPIDADVILAAEVVHALGDTAWFVGIGAMTAATAVASAVWWRRSPCLLGGLGAAAVAANLAQFGWFADHLFGVFAAPGTLFQAAWFVVAGVRPASVPRTGADRTLAA